MDLDSLIKKVDSLRKDLANLNLKTNDLLRLVPHFRLDWGMDDGEFSDEFSDEFNIGATKPIILSGLADADHKIKTNALLFKQSKIAELLVKTFIQERKLSKELLKEIHRLIIKNGGEWRTQEVTIQDQGGKLSPPYSSAENILGEIEGLITWYNKATESNKFHPVILSSIFHYLLVEIHPFLDGNGRLARIITSLILLSHGIPPPVTDWHDRQEYISCLRNADSGNLDPLSFFVGKKVVNSLEYVLSLSRESND